MSPKKQQTLGVQPSGDDAQHPKPLHMWGAPEESSTGHGVYQSTGRMIAEYCMIYDRV